MSKFESNLQADGQRNDCTIRALVTLTSLPYHAVSSVLTHYAGKRNHAGFAIYDFLDKHNGEVFGMKFEMCYRYADTGAYMIGNKQHVRAIVDGKTFDHRQWGMSYRYCYRVTPSGIEDKPLKLARVFAEL